MWLAKVEDYKLILTILLDLTQVSIRYKTN